MWPGRRGLTRLSVPMIVGPHYQTLTDLLHCEVPGLGYPRAALFAFSMATVAGNALAVLKGNLRVAHGVEVAAEVSDFALVDEVAEVYPG